jgi:O-antigen/teichoic acid export membrane protein
VSDAPRHARLLRDAVGYLPAMLVPAVVALVSATVFTRLFPPEEYGQFTLALSLIGPVATLLSQWLARPLERFHSEYEAVGQLPLLYMVVRRATVGIISIVVLLGTLISVIMLITGSGRNAWLLLLSGMLALAGQSVATVLLPLLSATFRIGLYRRFLVVSALASLAISLALVLLVSRNVVWLLWGHALGLALLVPVLMRQTGIAAPSPPGDMVDTEIRAITRRLVSFGFPMTAWFVAMALLSISDRYVLEASRGTSEQAIYSVNYNLIASVAALANVPVNIAVGPILYAAWAAGARDTVQLTIARMTELYAVLAVALVGGVGVVGEAFVRIVLAEEYHGGAQILVPVTIGIAIQGAANVGRKGLELHERTAAVAACAAAAATLNLALNVALIPSYGFAAAAYTTALSYIAYALLIGATSARVLPWLVPTNRVLGLTSMGAVAWCVGVLVVRLVQPLGPWAEFLAGGVGFLSVYVGLLWAFVRSRLASILATT